MPSVVIAAHNEEQVIGTCLRALMDQDFPGELQVVVSANGCSDRTVEIAREFGATIVDRREPGKAAALNAGDSVATSFPRIYLDADIVIPPHTIGALLRPLAPTSGRLAAVPRRRIETSGRPWPVRAYFTINERLPVFRKSLFGRGLIALSAEGRARFSDFPSLIADDLFVDSLFGEDEREVVQEVEVTVEAPHTTKDLLRRLQRVRRGNSEMRATATRTGGQVNVQRPQRWAWLVDVVLPNPRLALAAVPYAAITLAAAVLGHRRVRNAEQGWGRDDSTRSGEGSPSRTGAR